MNFSCQRDKLSDAVNVVSKAASVKSTITALEGIKAEIKDGKIKMSAYDFNVAISAVFDANTVENGTIIFPAKLFGDIVRKLPGGEDVYIEADESYQIKISCGGTVFNIMGVSPEDFPEIPSVSDENRVELTVSAFKRLIKHTVYAASQTDLKPILTGILFEINDSESFISAVGLDQYRLALKRESFEYKNGDISKFIVPAKTLKELLNILPEESENNIRICVSEKNVMFCYDNFVMISRTLEGEFLDYRKVIPADFKFKVRVKTRQLRSMIDRAALITSNAIKSPIRCDFDFDTVKISTASNIGKFTDVINVPNFEEKLTVGFNNKFMLEALSACDAEEILIRLCSELTPIILEPVEGEDFLSMVLPMRLNLDLK
ncbi:MAG: DNA polymerase III subunit beta [Clostridia bacterium]|nr:DNA polymerase III subunit beta [Clostridia bacterium]